MSGCTVLHSLTLASIEIQPGVLGLRLGQHSCGCELRAGKWWLCGYHEGYEDAVLLIGETLQKHHPESDFMITMRADVAEITICAECGHDWPCPTYCCII